MSGGQNNGEKIVRLTIACVLTSNGTLIDSDADGIVHRNQVEDIIAAIRGTAANTLGCQVTDDVRVDRQPPLSDDQGIAYLTYIEFECQAYVAG